MNVTAIIRAFCDVFEDCSLWNATPADWMLVGTRDLRGPVSARHFSAAWDHPTLGARLREVGVELPQQIGATFLSDADYLRALTAETDPLTDDFPRQVDSAHMRLPRSDQPGRSKTDFYHGITDTGRARHAVETSDFVRRVWPESLLKETLQFFEHQRVINEILFGSANTLRHLDSLHFVLSASPLRSLPFWILGMADRPLHQRIAGIPNDGSGSVEYLLGLQRLVARDYLGAAEQFADSAQRGFPSSPPL